MPVLVHGSMILIRVIYFINLTGQKQYMTELKWIRPVIMSRDSAKIILIPAKILYNHSLTQNDFSGRWLIKNAHWGVFDWFADTH